MGVAAEPLSRSAPSRFAPHPALSDGALARLVSKGDERAFESLYHRYRDQLHRYCGSILRQSQDAEEALQATMLNAYRALLAGQRDVAVKPWLYRIAHNQCISLMRRRSRHEELSGLEESVGGRVDERAEVSENLRQLRADLRQLPDQQRSALVLRELSGLSHEAIAETLDTTPAGAKQLIYEARQTLQEFGEGRALSCSDVRQRVSDGDGRLLRARRVKAHLRSCTGCSRFQASLVERPTRLAMLAPALPAIAAQRILEAVLASVGGGGTVVALAGAGTLGGGTGAGAWVTGIGGATEGAGAGGATVGAGAAGSGATAGGAAAGSAAAGAAAGGGGAAAAAGAGLSAAGAGAGAGLGGLAMKAAVVGAVALVGGSAAVVPLATQGVRPPNEARAPLSGTAAGAASGPGGLENLMAAAAGNPAPAPPAAAPSAPDAAAADPGTSVLGPAIGTIDSTLISMAAADPSAISSPLGPPPTDLGDAGSALASASASASAAAAAAQTASGAAAGTTSSSTAAASGAAAGATAGSIGSSPSGGASQTAGGAASGAVGGGSQPAPGGAPSPNAPASGGPQVRLTSIASIVRSLPVKTIKIPIVGSVVSRILPSAPAPAGTAAPSTPPATEPAAPTTAGPGTSEPASAPTETPSAPVPTPPTSSLPQVAPPSVSTVVGSLTSVLKPLLQGLTGAGSPPAGATPASSAGTDSGAGAAPADAGVPTSTAPTSTAPTPPAP
jgi:RNA polymerase sigma factor (sigma-70 family)